MRGAQMLFKMADRNVVTVLDILVALALAAVLILANGCIAPEPAGVPADHKAAIVTSEPAGGADDAILRGRLTSFAQSTRKARPAQTQLDVATVQWDNGQIEFDVHAYDAEVDLD
jgi:hypothetical protein